MIAHFESNVIKATWQVIFPLLSMQWQFIVIKSFKIQTLDKKQYCGSTLCTQNLQIFAKTVFFWLLTKKVVYTALVGNPSIAK